MVINNDDLEFLINLENKLGCEENWSKDVRRLWTLNEKLIRQRNEMREKTRRMVAEKRKSDKNYARKRSR